MSPLGEATEFLPIKVIAPEMQADIQELLTPICEDYHRVMVRNLYAVYIFQCPYRLPLSQLPEDDSVFSYMNGSLKIFLVPVVGRVDNVIQRINRCPANKMY